MRSTRIVAVAALAAVALSLGGTAIASAAAGPSAAPSAVPSTSAPAAAVSHAPARAAYVVTAHELNIRSGPGVDFRIIGALRHGSLVHANTATVNGFRELRPGVWMSARFLAPVAK